ncbi:MAG TPA: CvpA family protein [Burkholderiales bacterium]|jgi:membrane protein required for colicin V production|nr:CvpA family protein [Burkholderiales bacterium]
MTPFDYAVLVIVAVSILISVIRGLVREVLALLAWVAAFAVATLFGADVAAWMPQAIPTEELRLLTGFLIVFVGVLLVMSLAAMAISRLVKRAGLGVEDRMFGMLFGLARGGLIVLVLVLLAGLTTLPRDPLWRNAMLSSPLESLALYVKAWLPGDLSRRIKYD